MSIYVSRFRPLTFDKYKYAASATKINKPIDQSINKSNQNFASLSTFGEGFIFVVLMNFQRFVDEDVEVALAYHDRNASTAEFLQFQGKSKEGISELGSLKLHDNHFPSIFVLQKLLEAL